MRGKAFADIKRLDLIYSQAGRACKWIANIAAHDCFN